MRTPYLRSLYLVLFFLSSYLLLVRLHASSQPTNLIANPGFEQANNEPWILCGGAVTVTGEVTGSINDIVHGGQRALRMGQPIDNSLQQWPPWPLPSRGGRYHHSL